ncbi:flagellar motor switch protein FliG [Thermaerobacter composti]|uniref:Flagellar motor switch protein FliG n=1 Tax=Thermaerobacter composti TaxID=554949 RepID=A0ABZ0QS07_9FIRM|nr:flagellar motor switch protein FliG [Thermaerobacter composti]WPD20260.1 flagellar motor switch protein FliG [Thermaerobacter composti]
MPPRRKAAILMISLGPELAARVFRYLREDEIEQLTLEIANTDRVSPEQRQAVLEECRDLALAHAYVAQGGIDYARQLLVQALGHQRAAEVLNRLTATLQVRPFEFVRRADPMQILNFIQQEHPQTIALILAYLHPEQAAVVLSGLPPERRADVARRLALMERTSPELIREVERVLERKLSSVLADEGTAAGGLQAVVQVLNNVDRGTERSIMEVLEVTDPELAEEIKKRMFVFEDIVLLDDRSLQRVLREVDLNEDLPLALKAVSEEVKQKIFRNLSQRAVEILQENLSYLGPVRLRDVEEAQQKIVNIIRRLEEEGEIVIARGGQDEVVV